MSFWPRLRRRSRRRKRTNAAARTNPYATLDIDKYKVVHEELQAQRCQSAEQTSLVQFLSRSSRGFVYLPVVDTQTPSETTPRTSQHGSEEVTPLDVSIELSVPPAVALWSAAEKQAVGAEDREEEEKSGQDDLAAESSSIDSAVTGLDDKAGESRNVSRLVITRTLKDEAWLLISTTAAVLCVKVLVVSRALGAHTAFAFTVAVVVNSWNRGKGSAHRLFSALTAQLLTTLTPYLSLKPRGKSISSPPRPTPAPSAAPPSPKAEEQNPVVNAAKVSPVTEDPDAFEARTSSFAFPVLMKESLSPSSRFPLDQWQDDFSAIASPVEDRTSAAPIPLAESNKLPSAAKSCKPCKFKSKLFRSSPARKGENASPSAEGSELNDVSSSGSSSTLNSPGRGKSSTIKKRSPWTHSKVHEEVSEEGCSPSSSLKLKKKGTRSHELLFFIPNNSNKKKEAAAAKEVEVPPAVQSSGVKDVSRSQELKFSLRNLGRKMVSRSEEFTSSAPSSVQDLALSDSTVDELKELAFPFHTQGRGQGQDKSSLPSSPRQSSSIAKRKNSRAGDSASSSPREQSPRRASSDGSAKGGRLRRKSESSAHGSSTKTSAMQAAAELKPGLRRVRTAAPAAIEEGSGSGHRRARGAVSSLQPQSLPSDGEPITNELANDGRSQVLRHEIIGSILLLSVLVFLLVGRIPAILATSCLCLVLSHVQRFLQRNETPRIELTRRSSGMSNLQYSSSSPSCSNANSSNPGSLAPERSELQSSEYRKRVLIEGLLDRGNNRRGGNS